MTSRPTHLPATTTRRVVVRGLLAVSLAVSLAALAACGHSPAKASRHLFGSYAALGDSYSAGVMLSPITNVGCLRSSKNYAGLLANKLNIAGLDDATCGGATSKNLTAPQVTANGTNPPQLDAVTPDTNLVTIGLGLNDYSLSYISLYACLPVNGVRTAQCTAYLNAAPATLALYVKDMGLLVINDLKEIRAKAPKARIVLVGYPRMLPDNKDCPDQVPVPAEAANRTREILRDVNSSFITIAKQQHVDYLNMYAASQGHDVCSSDPWVNGQHLLPGKAYPFHPFASYHVAVADRLAALLTK